MLMYTFREAIGLVASSIVLGWLLRDIWWTVRSPEFCRDLERLREQRRLRKAARRGP